MTRKEILDNSIKCVCGDREVQYGKPEENFAIIARYWTAYLEMAHKNLLITIKPKDVGMMMCLLKIARIASGQTKNDNYIDLAGYAACAGEIATKGEKENG